MKSLYRYLNRLLFYTLLFISFCSCKKYLNDKPDKTLVVPTSLDDLQAILDNSNQMNVRTTPNFGEASSDDYFLLPGTFNSQPEENQKIYTWNRGDYLFQNDWSFAYVPIYNSNYCLEQLNSIPVTPANESRRNNVMGSALFYRSYYFLNLMWVYAKAYDETTANTDLGIVLRETSDFNVPSKRSSVRDCYERIIRDAEDAAIFLPDLPLHVMRPSKISAYGLLARAYLSMRNYDSALKYSNLCLQVKSDLIDYRADDDINGSLASNTPFKKYNKETVFYSEMNTTYYIILPGSRAKVDTSLYLLYADNDLRKGGYFRPNSGYQQFKGSYAASTSTLFSGIATDEMFLTRAESYARTGKIIEAMADLNYLLQFRHDSTFVPLLANSQSDALIKILNERRKELVMRGIRWMDIKRLNREGANIILMRNISGQTYTLQPNSNYYALPLPADIIQQTGIPQNPLD